MDTISMNKDELNVLDDRDLLQWSCSTQRNIHLTDTTPIAKLFPWN